MSERETPFEIELTITPGERLPVEQLYAERERDRLEQEQQNALQVDVSEAGLAKSATAAERMPSAETARDEEREIARTKAANDLRQGPVRQAVSGVLKTLAGVDLDEIEAAITAGTLPEQIGLKLADPVGNTMEALVRQTAAEQAVPAEISDSVATATGLLAGIIFPIGAGKKARVLVQAAERTAAIKKLKAMLGKVEPTAGAGEKLGTAEHAEGLTSLMARDVPKGEARVNVERVDAAKAVKRTMEELNRLHAERLAKSRATVGHAETIEASRGALSLEQALALSDETILLDKDKGTALRDLYVTAAAHLTDLAKRTRQGDAQAAGQLWDSFVIASELAVKDELAGRTVARALEARKIPSEIGRATLEMDALTRLRALLEGAQGADALALAARIEALAPAQRKTMLLQVGHGLRTGQSVFYEAWINALLSGPQTHAANVISNSLTAAWAPAERFLAANLDFGRDRSVFHGEALAMLYGVVEGARDGFRLVGKALREGSSGFGGEKVERAKAITSEAMGLSPDSTLGHAIDYLGALVRVPTRLLTMEDAFFKGLNYRMELRALAWREAKQEGLSGEAFAERVRQIIAAPPAEVKARAETFALVQTFNRELSELGWVGGLGGGLMKAADAVPMGRVVLPFVRTPTNIMHFTMERTPILNALSDTLRADILAGGERRALAFGKVGASLMAAGAVAALATSGRITGPGPKDKNLLRELRETGWQPNSIKLGDTWYSINRLDPLGSTLLTLATYAEIAGQIPEGGRAEFAAAMALAISRSMVSKTYLEGLSNVLEAIESPERGAEKYVRSLARTLVPTGVRQVARVLDPTLRETRALTEADSLLNEIKAGIPGYAETLPPRRNLFGEPVRLSGGWGPDLISPIYTSTVKDDPVVNEIVRHRVSLSLPARVIGGTAPPELRMQQERATEGIRLTPEEYDRLAVLTAEGPEGQPTLKDKLAELIASDVYQRQSDGPDGGKAWAIKKAVETYKDYGRNALRRESPELDQIVRERLEQKIRARQPAGAGSLGPGLVIPGQGR